MRKPGFGGLLCGVIEAIGTLTGTCWGGPRTALASTGTCHVLCVQAGGQHLPSSLATFYLTVFEAESSRDLV